MSLPPIFSRRAVLAAAAGLMVPPFAGEALAQAGPGLAPGDLVWPEARPEELAFMRRVYSAHLAKAGRNRAMAGDLPPSKLAAVEGGAQLLAAAAADCRALLAAARAAAAAAKSAREPAALAVNTIGVLSAYRPASHQFRLWNQAFPSYFAETAPLRLTLKGGPLGEEAVAATAAFVRRHLAAPGFSLHNTGRAVDFQATEGGVWLQADRSQRALWRASWFHGWLVKSAPTYRFHANTKIDEPWHWEWW